LYNSAIFRLAHCLKKIKQSFTSREPRENGHAIAAARRPHSPRHITVPPLFFSRVSLISFPPRRSDNQEIQQPTTFTNLRPAGTQPPLPQWQAIDRDWTTNSAVWILLLTSARAAQLSKRYAKDFGSKKHAKGSFLVTQEGILMRGRFLEKYKDRTWADKHRGRYA